MGLTRALRGLVAVCFNPGPSLPDPPRDDRQLMLDGQDPNLVVAMTHDELSRLVHLKQVGHLVPNEAWGDRAQLVRVLLSEAANPQVPRAVAKPNQRRRALLVGINYQDTEDELGGCFMDTRYMYHLLTTKFGFVAGEILMLNEFEPNENQIPTAYNIRQGIRWLMADVREGDSLVFMYSGHGGQQRGRAARREELDGMNETIMPLDHEEAGDINDKELHQKLVAPLPTGARLFALCDSCHSGTILDLPYACTPSRFNTSMQWGQAQRVFKGTAGGLAVCISGCRDDQTSQDTSELSKGQAQTGAMIYSFVQSVEQGRATTYGNLLLSMRDIISTALKEGYSYSDIGQAGLSALLALNFRSSIATMGNMFMSGSEVQVPQMSSSHQFDLSQVFTI